VAENGQEETVEYFLHSSHPIRIIITHADGRPRNINNESSCYRAMARSAYFDIPDRPVR
jgi:hypothetical protein